MPCRKIELWTGESLFDADKAGRTVPILETLINKHHICPLTECLIKRFSLSSVRTYC